MIGFRRFRHLITAVALGLLARPDNAWAGPSAAGQMTARWESVRAPAISQAVLIDGKWHAAGQAYVRVDGQADAAVYSLSLMAALDRVAELGAIDPDSSAIANLPQITSLARESSRDAGHQSLTDSRAAAYQVAIWHLTDNLPIDDRHVPDAGVRRLAGDFLSISKKETDTILKCKGGCASPLSTAATAAVLNVKVGGTVNDSALRIAIATTGEKYFDHRHYVDLRINGEGATLCAGETDRVRVDKPATHDVSASSCEFRKTDPERAKDPKAVGLPRLNVERVSSLAQSQVANNTIIAYIPRQSEAQQVEVSWIAGNDAGMIFAPNGPSAPVITASNFSVSRVQTVTVDPANFSSFQEVIQRSVLPVFTGHGEWRLLLLAVLLIVLLLLKDAAAAAFKLFGRGLRWLWRAGVAWRTKRKLAKEERRAELALSARLAAMEGRRISNSLPEQRMPAPPASDQQAPPVP